MPTEQRNASGLMTSLPHIRQDGQTTGSSSSNKYRVKEAYIWQRGWLEDIGTGGNLKPLSQPSHHYLRGYAGKVMQTPKGNLH